MVVQVNKPDAKCFIVMVKMSDNILLRAQITQDIHIVMQKRKQKICDLLT